MAEENFSSLGKIEAIGLLYEGSGYTHIDKVSFERANGSHIYESSAIYLEGIDFDLTYFPLKHLGYKCVIGVTGELYSSLASPRILSVKLGVSAKLDYPRIKELWSGIVAAAKEHGYGSVSLDLVPSKNGLVISMAATGETSLLTFKRRSKAQSKDLICVSGSLGAALLGLQVLEKERMTFDMTSDDTAQPSFEKYKMIVGDYIKPDLSPDIVAHLEDSEIYPSYGYFVTKGLADAVKRLVRDSGLGAKIYADKIPFEGNSFELGKELNIDPVSAAMNGGDDFRLLFVVPILSLDKFRHDFQSFDIIGHLAKSEVGAVLVSPDGVELPLKAQGWKEEDI